MKLRIFSLQTVKNYEMLKFTESSMKKNEPGWVQLHAYVCLVVSFPIKMLNH